MTIVLGGREYFFTPFAFVLMLLAIFAALWLAFRLVGFLMALLRFFAGDETAIRRFFNRSRERRGLKALARALVALAAGDAKEAQKNASSAELLLRRPELTRIVNAQAAELAGDASRAEEYYRALARDPETAFVGIRGLLNRALERGDTARALKLAEYAARLRPRDPAILDTLYTLQTRSFDWAGARRTLALQRRYGLLPAEEVRRRDAMLALALAEEAEEAGRIEEARRLALEAARLDPANDEAVTAAARHLVAAGSKRRAAKLLIEAWRRRPSPRLAAAYAEIEPDESPEERRRRFRKLLNANPLHPESKIVAAELALMTRDWAGARQALEGLPVDQVDNGLRARHALVMAAVARGEGAPETEVRAWLARALEALGGEDLESEIRHAALLPLLVGGAEEAGEAGSTSGKEAADAATEAAAGATEAAAGATAETVPEGEAATGTAAEEGRKPAA